jgi:nucleoside phosphorylase
MKMRSLVLVWIVGCGSTGNGGGANVAQDPATPSHDAPPSSTPPSSTSNPDDKPPPPSDAGADAGTQFIVVVSAFPAEMAPLVAQATIERTQVINGKTFRIGTLAGVRVALGLVGMGLASATATAHAALKELTPAPTGVVFSGVAGSKVRIGDVVVPTTWQLKTTGTYTPDAKWLGIATSMLASGALCFEQCTEMPSTGVPVCMDHVPGLFVGGVGKSDETSVPVSCKSGGDDVFGCDVGTPQGAAHTCATAGAIDASLADAGADPLISDNETGAVAAEAAALGLPFIAFRGVSDGAGDPLGLPGYPTEFFAYYRLAARNAAAATKAFVERAGK